MNDTPYEQKPNSGTLFVSKTKKSEKSPDYYGDILVRLSDFDLTNDTVKIRISGWKKQSRSGSNFLSLAISPSEERQEPKSIENLDSDIPF
jgi:hypothetical protein